MALVPTGIKAGVLISPWGVDITPERPRRSPPGSDISEVISKVKDLSAIWVI
ncbi:unannotated protein [freshwater metagenome]|uniref:Unannotated protein n=1 Tax=freshwater metagenome TaxID=449393 RepID=A0A6J6XEL5_9ZZZZ